jgi:hypothetical protein
MNRFLTKLQKQDIGNMLSAGGYSPLDFILQDENDNEGVPFAKLVHRISSDELMIRPRPAEGLYWIQTSVPGTERYSTDSPVDWDRVLYIVQQWATDLRLENEAVDPWEEEAENMANDDSYFTADELPRVDRAIDASLLDLQQKAVEAGKKNEAIEAELSEIKLLLKKAARNSTKKEWLNIFKGIIVGKLVDWGMKTVIFNEVLHVLIDSAHDIAQLAEHASRHLPTIPM